MELKYSNLFRTFALVECSNRTFMELKYKKLVKTHKKQKF